MYQVAGWAWCLVALLAGRGARLLALVSRGVGGLCCFERWGRCWQRNVKVRVCTGTRHAALTWLSTRHVACLHASLFGHTRNCG